MYNFRLGNTFILFIMIDTTILQSSSLFAGFANLGEPVEATIDIPGNQLIPGFAGSVPVFFADVKRPSQQSLSQVLFQVKGITTLYGLPFDQEQWKSSASTFATWFQPDGDNFEIQCDVLNTTPGNVRLRVSYVTLQFGDQTYVPPIQVNAKVYFFKYPWE